MQRDITAAPELIRKGDGFAVLQVKRAVAVHHRVGLIVLAGGILRPDRFLQTARRYRAVVRDGILLGRKADAGAAACIRCCRRVQCGIMGRPVFDADRELAGGIREVGLQQAANIVRIDLFFHLQLVMIREVERHRHVGLPHTALHVVHGKGVLGVLGERHLFVFFALPFELITRTPKGYAFGVTSQRVIILVVAVFNLADVGCNGVVAVLVRAKLQQTFRFCTGTADIQHQLVINEHPHIIIAGEEELDGDFLALIFSYYDLAVLCQRKVKLQFSTVTVVVLVDMIACILVEGEEAVAACRFVHSIKIL